MIWKLLKRGSLKTHAKKTVSDEELISDIAHSWCYYAQYVHSEKTLIGKIEYFRNSKRDLISEKYISHKARSPHEIDTLIYDGISQGSVLDDGENNAIQHCLNTHFLSEVTS